MGFRFEGSAVFVGRGGVEFSDAILSFREFGFPSSVALRVQLERFGLKGAGSGSSLPVGVIHKKLLLS